MRMWSLLVNVPGELGSLLGSSVVRTWYFHCQRSGFNPRSGNKDPTGPGWRLSEGLARRLRQHMAPPAPATPSKSSASPPAAPATAGMLGGGRGPSAPREVALLVGSPGREGVKEERGGGAEGATWASGHPALGVPMGFPSSAQALWRP